MSFTKYINFKLINNNLLDIFMNILLTGGAGYIGSHAALSLLDAGHNVHIIDNLSTGNESLIPHNAFFTKCNINEEEAISKLIKLNNFDLLMHFAGFIQVEESVKNPQKYFDNNTENATKLFETCKNNGLNKIVFSSTAAAYGSVSENKLIDENANLNPQNPYAESKIKTENFLLKNKHDYKFIILRYFNVAGADPKLKYGIISKKNKSLIKVCCQNYLSNKNIRIFGKNFPTSDGTTVRDYIHVKDLAIIHHKIFLKMNKNLKNTILNCGYGKGYSTFDIVNYFVKKSNNKIGIKYLKRKKSDLPKSVAEIKKISRFLNWVPKYKNINKILDHSLKWEKKIR